MILITSTVTYLNTYIIPGLTIAINAGLLCKAILEIMKVQSEEEERTFKLALQKSKKYIIAMIVCTIIATIITAIDSYY